ncbi:hypothetical protein D6C93_05533, partial [Aureobasidium pullulans]
LVFRETNRPVLGGTIAILKSLGESTLPDLSLLFHQDSTSTTRATFQSSLPAVSDLDSCQIVIFKDGDLRAEAPATSILHAFPLEMTTREQSFSLPRKLDLGVGGEGVIGRRVGLVRQAQVLRQGIIGYN